MELISEYMLITAGATCGWERAFILDLLAHHLRLNERHNVQTVEASYARAVMTGMKTYDRTGVKPGCREQTE